MGVAKRLMLVVFVGVLAFGQQADREALREESLTPEQFRQAHAPLVKPRDSAADPSAITDQIAPAAGATAVPPAVRRNFIDEHVFSRIDRDRIPHAPPSGDAEFLRRVQLDLIGRIPTPSEVRAFVEDTDPGKRARKIDELLDREAFSEKWAYFFMDLFRANGKMGRGRELFHYWLKENLRSDRPYDEWVRAIIASAGKSSNVMAASNVIAREHVQGKAQPDDGHDMGMVHQLDTHDELTILYGKVFLGINLSCISCHDGGQPS